MNWPRKYRPQTIADLALPEVQTVLNSFVDNKNFPQAFLFAGPKGTGKTSTSRIIAALLNPSLDAIEKKKIWAGNSYLVAEIDAASNRGIDDIRALRERVFMPPAVGDKSIYILDEAHMLTREAFNALLKILEEPPAHVVFILATTELHKIPETVISRCQLINFRKAELAELQAVLAKILTAEKIDFEPAALLEIAKRANGSFRDALKVLELLVLDGKKLKLANLEQALHLSIEGQILALLQAVLEKNELQVSKIMAELRAADHDADFVYQTLFSTLHQQLLLALNKSQEAKFSSRVSHFLLSQLQALPREESAVIPLLALELKLLELVFRAKQKSK